jgi:hypothetical protein
MSETDAPVGIIGNTLFSFSTITSRNRIEAIISARQHQDLLFGYFFFDIIAFCNGYKIRLIIS